MQKFNSSEDCKSNFPRIAPLQNTASCFVWQSQKISNSRNIIKRGGDNGHQEKTVSVRYLWSRKCPFKFGWRVEEKYDLDKKMHKRLYLRSYLGPVSLEYIINYNSSMWDLRCRRKLSGQKWLLFTEFKKFQSAKPLEFGLWYREEE